MSEDEEDYMSDAFLAKLDDVRPGLKRVTFYFILRKKN